MSKPEHNYYSVYELVDRWSAQGITEEDLLRYGKEARLQFSIVLKPQELTEKILVSKKKSDGSCVVKTKEFYRGQEIALKIKAQLVGIFLEIYKKGEKATRCNVSEINKLLEKPSEGEFIEIKTIKIDTHSEFIASFKISLDNIVVKTQDVLKFEARLNEPKKPSYLNPDHKHYSKEIEALTEAWISIFERKKILDKKSCKQAAMKFIENNYGHLPGWTTGKGGKIDQLGVLLNACISTAEWNEFVKDIQDSNPTP